MIVSLHPALIFMIGAAVAAVSPGKLRNFLVLATPIAAFASMVLAAPETPVGLALFDYDLVIYRADRLSLLFGYLFSLAAFIGGVYALHVRDRLQQVAALAYAGTAVGIVFAGDMITLFVFWELAAITSVFLIFARRCERSTRAGLRYLAFQVVSGLMLLAGVLIIAQKTGSIAFNAMTLDGLGTWLVFLAFGIKCGFPLLHNWLTDAYPEATPTGTVFLSALTTKAAVYALARGFAGTEILIYIGTAMTVFPIFYAVIENDLRRVLCYSMINQIGFMVAGIGIGTELALNGAISHAFNDVIFKGLLFMSMGAVLHMTGRINGSALGGLYKSMPQTTTLCIVGAASISAFPLFSGFVSKSMVMAAMLEEGHVWLWLFLLFASAGVFHHAGIKIPFFAFFARDAGIRVKEPPINMRIAMLISAALSIGIGIYPWPLYALLPFPVEYAPFAITHVVSQVQLLFFSALAFAWLKLSGLYPPELHSVNIDAEWTYRWLAPRLFRGMAVVASRVTGVLGAAATGMVDVTVKALRRHYGPRAAAAAGAPIGGASAWVALLLALSLVVYYWQGAS